MLENAMSFQAIGNGAVINFKKMSAINAYGRFKFTTFLNPPSREEAKIDLRTTIPHSSLALRTRSAKRKKPEKSECEY